jgi:hypothetical protein
MGERVSVVGSPALVSPPLGQAPFDIGRRGKNLVGMEIAALVLVLVLLLVSVVLMLGLFVWAAVKDGQADKAVQARLGIRRRTRLGR